MAYTVLGIPRDGPMVNWTTGKLGLWLANSQASQLKPRRCFYRGIGPVGGLCNLPVASPQGGWDVVLNARVTRLADSTPEQRTAWSGGSYVPPFRLLSRVGSVAVFGA